MAAPLNLPLSHVTFQAYPLTSPTTSRHRGKRGRGDISHPLLHRTDLTRDEAVRARPNNPNLKLFKSALMDHRTGKRSDALAKLKKLQNSLWEGLSSTKQIHGLYLLGKLQLEIENKPESALKKLENAIKIHTNLATISTPTLKLLIKKCHLYAGIALLQKGSIASKEIRSVPPIINTDLVRAYSSLHLSLVGNKDFSLDSDEPPFREVPRGGGGSGGGGGGGSSSGESAPIPMEGVTHETSSVPPLPKKLHLEAEVALINVLFLQKQFPACCIKIKNLLKIDEDNLEREIETKVISLEKNGVIPLHTSLKLLLLFSKSRCNMHPTEVNAVSRKFSSIAYSLTKTCAIEKRLYDQIRVEHLFYLGYFSDVEANLQEEVPERILQEKQYLELREILPLYDTDQDLEFRMQILVTLTICANYLGRLQEAITYLSDYKKLPLKSLPLAKQCEALTCLGYALHYEDEHKKASETFSYMINHLQESLTPDNLVVLEMIKARSLIEAEEYVEAYEYLNELQRKYVHDRANLISIKLLLLETTYKQTSFQLTIDFGNQIISPEIGLGLTNFRLTYTPYQQGVVYHYLALAYLGKNNLEKFYEVFSCIIGSEVILLNYPEKSIIDLIENYSIALEETEDYEIFTENLEKILETGRQLTPANRCYILMELANTYNNLDKLDEALENYTKIIDIEPSIDSLMLAYYNRGIAKKMNAIATWKEDLNRFLTLSASAPCHDHFKDSVKESKRLLGLEASTLSEEVPLAVSGTIEKGKEK